MTTRYLPPHRLPVRLANGLLGTIRSLGLARRPLDAERMKAWARHMTGLNDFGDPFYEEPLKLLIDDINNDTDLHEAGRLFHWYFISGFLRNRLRMVEAWKRNPEILREEIKAPLVILGLPRTATTRLFNIMAGSPALKTLTFWEASSPAPGRIEKWLPFSFRKLKAHFTLGAVDFLAPNFKSIHQLLFDGPEECIHLFGNSLASWIFPVEYNSPHYTKWFETVDHLQPYDEFKAQLQLLQWQRPNASQEERWLLKSPHHLFGLDALLKVFPDAMIVQTHRDPAKVVPSCCSLAQTTRGIASTSLDPALIGAQMGGTLAAGLQKTVEMRKQIPASRIMDVHFQEIVAEPIEVARRIHETFTLDFDPEVEKGIKRELARETPGRYGKHSYTLEQFGLSNDIIESKFGTYYEAFDITREGQGN